MNLAVWANKNPELIRIRFNDLSKQKIRDDC